MVEVDIGYVAQDVDEYGHSFVHMRFRQIDRNLSEPYVTMYARVCLKHM